MVIIGETYGCMTIIEEVGRDKYGCRLFKAICKCGSYRIDKSSSFACHIRLHCKECQWAEYKPHEVGTIIDAWTILSYTRDVNKRLGYICRCKCGDEHFVAKFRLHAGTSRMCGKCSKTTHGMYGTPSNYIWRSMIQRCTNPNAQQYRLYGGRGIRVCERWRCFENFIADMGVRPDGLTLDRIDPDGDYEPGNCRWATMRENNANRRCSPVNRHRYIYARRDKLCDKCLSQLARYP